MIAAPSNLDWPSWVARWDRMQERYLVARQQRFATIARLIAATQGEAPHILDLGCGTGSLMAALLEAIPGARLIGVDLDPTLLLLAEERLAGFGDRARLLLADLRQAGWPREVPGPMEAAVSATALHWLSPDQLSALYHQIAGLLHPNGIFLNADHAASDSPSVQAAWVSHREEMRLAQPNPPASDDWDGFWNAYLAALGPQARAARQQALGEEQGVEQGMPLAWHFDQLRAAGFGSVDCFLRLDCDAIYGGVRT